MFPQVVLVLGDAITTALYKDLIISCAFYGLMRSRICDLCQTLKFQDFIKLKKRRDDRPCLWSFRVVSRRKSCADRQLF